MSRKTVKKVKFQLNVMFIIFSLVVTFLTETPLNFDFFNIFHKLPFNLFLIVISFEREAQRRKAKSICFATSIVMVNERVKKLFKIFSNIWVFHNAHISVNHQGNFSYLASSQFMQKSRWKNK